MENRNSSLCITIITSIFLLSIVRPARCLPASPNDADHITAIYGDSVVLNCNVDFPDGTPVPYVVQWSRKDQEEPIYMWYANYPEHVSPDYAGRVSRVSPKSNYGLASLNLTQITERDRGWYNCKVMFINRDPDAIVNGTWFHLDVHAKPHFTVTPEDIVYVNIKDSIILNCQAGGTPVPEILWFKEEQPVTTSNRLGIFNDGTELRISNILPKDLGDYTCIARNGEGRIHHTARVVIAGAPVIVTEPKNLTKLAGSEARFPCKGQANPGNLTVVWFKDGIPIKTIGALSSKAGFLSDGTLVIQPVSASDEGMYSCEVTNGIGRPIKATAYLGVEYPARVTYTPTSQYIPRGLKGIIQCHIEANPEIQFVTWSKDKRVYDPFDVDGVFNAQNGSLIIESVNQRQAGEYVCTPYNIHGTAGPSGVMQVLIKDPPTLMRRPEKLYHRSVGGKVTMPCGAIGVPHPDIKWRKLRGRLPHKRSKVYNGELTIENLRKSDHGVYECVVSNEVATITAKAELYIEKTTPHAPTNITITETEVFAVTIQWLPGYSGCASCKQSYKIRYREKDSKFPNWIELPVNPPDARKIQIHNLSALTKYEFQVIGTNEYGDGMFSEIIEASTKGDGHLDVEVRPPPTASPSEQSTFSDAPPGERPAPATNLTLNQEAGGWVLRWITPKEDPPIQYYTIQVKTDSQGSKWLPLTDQKVDVEEASYMFKNMGTAKAYLFRVFSHSLTSYSVSEEMRYGVPENVKRRAVTAGLIGGILFFIVAIVLSICTVKICNKRRREKHDRAINEIQRLATPTYNMVACRVSEARNGSQVSQVPLKRHRQSGVPVVNTIPLKQGFLTVYHCVAECILDIEMQLHYLANHAQNDNEGRQKKRSRRKTRGRRGTAQEPNEPDYSAGKGRRSRRYSSSRSVAYSLKIEPQIPQKNPSFICRTTDGKFVLTRGNGLENDADDEGGFGVNLPPNKFRTRSVAIVAGYSPERLYSNVPPGAFVVESGVYKVGADREWERPEPIYWKQVVFESENDDSIKKRNLRSVGDREQPASEFQINSHLDNNLELPIDKDYNKLRASSPLDGGTLLGSVEYLSPMNFSSELSSVRQPSSAEKSIPSTLNPHSSTTTSGSYPTTLTMDSDLTPRSRFTTSSSKSQTELETIHEDYSSSEYLVKADIHHYQKEDDENIFSNSQIPQPQIAIADSNNRETISNYENAPVLNNNQIVPLATSSPPPHPPEYEPEYENMAIVRLVSTNIDDEEVRAITSSSSTSSPSPTKKINDDLRGKDHFYENWPPIPPPTYHARPCDAISCSLSPSSSHDAPGTANSTPIGVSRPNSSHSAPLLDLSIDRHYEFDSGGRSFLNSGESPIDDLTLFPRRVRPYYGYNPRRDRPEFGNSLNESEQRVFSDSEIYSPVFPRGRPHSEAPYGVAERIEAMKERFEDYRRTHLRSKSNFIVEPSSLKTISSTISSPTNIKTSAENPNINNYNNNRLESLI
ncbi:protein turtle isoform X4 [Lepeophtheirus salmonis]|uniref:protein turtle isoform X4 n=1 Tax=Lepeophtheirus salmonis TaxID=72036 RepID=UPI001AE5E518|nr:protein turtle-like isoform X4 [Lepeophtheirus salmonis]